MSPLQKTGVQLVAENESGFLGALEKSTRSVETFGARAEKASGGLHTTNSALAATASAMGQMSIATLAVGTALGGVLLGGVQAIMSGLMNFVTTGVQAVSAIQDLEINLQTLAAREILYSGATDDMNTALAQGKPVADQMLKSLQDLSIMSPFQYQQIVEVFQMNMAFGQTSSSALELTRAITNLGAVNKGIPGILQRLSYNFSQMSMVGKISARDVRDLAMAGLDLKKVLKLQLNMTLEETNQALESGKLTFEDVSKALVAYTDKYVGPAAERASRTLGGLASTFKDITFFASANLLKPAAENITVALGALLDVVLKIVNSNAFKMIGAMLQGLTAPIKSAGEWLAKLTATTQTTEAEFQKMPESMRYLQTALENSTPMQTFLSNMEKMANRMIDYGFEAMQWGVNIVTQLADGIISAATTVLVAAMNFIGNVLSSWLSPGSPPKIAPDLDQWGMDAMREYLLGWTEADFSVLKGIQQPLQEAMQYAVAAGQMTSDEMNVLFAGISRDMIAAMSTGAGMEDIFSRIAQAAGPFSGEVLAITQTQFQLATATEAARAAQERLNQAQKDYQMQGQKVSKGILEYNNLLRQGASKDVLRAKLAQINADKQAQAQSAKGIVSAQKEVQAASEGIGALQQSLALQQQMLQLMTSLAKQTITTPEAEAKGAGGKAAGMGAGGPKYTAPDTSGLEDALTKKMDELKERIAGKMKELFQPILDLFNNTIKPALALLGTAWDTLTGKIALLGPKMDELRATLANWWAVLQQVWAAIMTTLQPAWDSLMETLNLGAIDWKTILDFMWNVVLGVINAIGWIFLGLVGIITGVVNGIIEMYNFWIQMSRVLQAVILGIWDAIKEFLSGILKIILGIFTLNLGLIWEGVKQAFTGILNFVIGIGKLLVTQVVMSLGAIITFIGGFVTGVIDFFKNLFDALVGKSIIPDMLAAILKAFTDTFAGLITLIGEQIQAIITTISGWVTNFVTAGSDLVGGLVQGVVDGAGKLADAAVQAVKDAIAAAKKALGIKSPSKVFMEIGANVTYGMAEGMKQGATTVSQASTGMANAMTQSIVAPPRTNGAASLAGGRNSTVNVQFGDVTITNQAEGDMFEARVQRAVRSALGVGI